MKHFSVEKISTLEKNDLKRNSTNTETDFVFIFIVRLVGNKDINELIAAFLKLEQINVKLLLVSPHEQSINPFEYRNFTTNKKQ